MKKNIEITILKENKVTPLINKTVEIELNESNNVKELIEKLKPMVYELKYFQIVKEELYRGTQKLKEDKTVPPDNGIELEITVK